MMHDLFGKEMEEKPNSSAVQIVVLEPIQCKLNKATLYCMLRAKSPRVQLFKKNGKSDIWQRFSTIRVDGELVDFCACDTCGAVVPIRTGTNGMRVHKCKDVDLHNNSDFTPKKSAEKKKNIGTQSYSRISTENEYNSRSPADTTKRKPQSQTLERNKLVKSEKPKPPIGGSVALRRQRDNSKMHCDEKVFKVDVDCAFFKPKELSVKTVGDDLVIHGEHNERQDELGYIKRQFTRRINIPRNVEMEKLSSSFSSSGILTIEAPKKRCELPKERVITIKVNSGDFGNEFSDETECEYENQNENEDENDPLAFAVRSIVNEADIPSNNEEIANSEEVTHEEITL